MRKFLMILCILLSVLILAGAAFALHLFVIGEPVDGNSGICHCEVTETDHQINIYVTTPASAVAFRDNARLHQDGSELHITLYKVLVSSLNPSGQWSMYLETTDLTKVYLGGKLIWSAE